MHDLDLQLAERSQHPQSRVLVGSDQQLRGIAESVAPEAPGDALQVLVRLPAGSEPGAWRSYGEYASGLLRGQAMVRRSLLIAATKRPGSLRGKQARRGEPGIL